MQTAFRNAHPPPDPGMESDPRDECQCHRHGGEDEEAETRSQKPGKD